MPVLAGIAADNISAVSLTVNGVTSPLGIQNNAFYADLSLPAAAESPWTTELEVGYRDGSVVNVPIPDPRS